MLMMVLMVMVIGPAALLLLLLLLLLPTHPQNNGLDMGQIAKMFLAGIVSSMVTGLFAGALLDRCGRVNNSATRICASASGSNAGDDTLTA